MKTVFADTTYWIALVNRRDRLHEKAEELAFELSSTLIVTSEMVLVEVLNHFAEAPARVRLAALTLIEGVYDSPNHEVIPQTAGQFRDSMRFYKQRLDKQWSLTDCSSMLIMKAEGISEALTYDKHFSQAGFEALLRSSS